MLARGAAPEANVDRALCRVTLLLLILSACSPTNAGNQHASVPAALPEGTSVATIVLPPVSPDGWTGTALREMPLDVYVRPVGTALAAAFAGPPGEMIGPQDRNLAEGVDSAFTVDVTRHRGWCEMFQEVDRVPSEVDGSDRARSLYTATLRPLDDDGDGVADQLCATLDGGGTASLCSEGGIGQWEWTHEGCAPLRPLGPATAELVTSTVASGEAVQVRFSHPMTVTSARFVRPDGTAAAAQVYESGMCDNYNEARQAWLGLDELLPWGATVTYEIEGELAVLGGEPLTATGTIQVTPPPGAWTTSFEDGELAGLLVSRGTAEAADETSGVPPLDGARFLLANSATSEYTRLVFELQVPATDPGTLAVEARFVYRSDPGTDLPALPSFWLEILGEPDGVGHGPSLDPTVASPLAGDWFGATGAVTARLDLGPFAGRSVLASINVSPWDRTCAPRPDGVLQLDGLRIEP